MKYAQFGVILFVEDYDACVAFYRDRLSLSVVGVQDGLTRFAFGAAYLMLEKGGVSSPHQKARAQNPAVLRFDVADVRAAAAELGEKGVAVELREFSWGTIGVFAAPDGNRCELKNAA